MGNRKQITRMLKLLGLFFILVLGTAVYGEDCEIEQVSLRMPQVKVYYRSAQPESEYEAYLGGKALAYDSTVRFRDTGEGTDYYLMLDISASISREQFESLKAGILSFISSRGPEDRCILMTFGNEARVVLDGSESPEQAGEVLAPLKNEDMETVLFQAIVQTAEMIDKAAQTEEKRRVCIAVTDGEDCVTGKATAAEALDTLNSKGIPLYAVAVNVGKEEYVNSFGEFARKSGGTLSMYTEGDSLGVLDGIRNQVLDSFVASFHSATNEASNQREDFTLKFLTQKVTATREVIPTLWIPDSQPPVVEELEPEGDKEIRITFSEPVLGADNKSNYKVTVDGEALAVVSASYGEENGPEAVLTFQEPFYTGEYQVALKNLTDTSMERNALQTELSLEIQGRERENEILQFIRDWWWIVTIVLLVLAVLAVILIVRAVKKVKAGKGVIYVDGKATLASQVDVKQHVSTEGMPTKNVRLQIRDRINGRCELEVSIQGSTMVGRSSQCDVYFDDRKMSRQHFVLETDGAEVYITDLETVNGTYVNGVLLSQRRRLVPGDEISAGDVTARIVW